MQLPRVVPSDLSDGLAPPACPTHPLSAPVILALQALCVFTLDVFQGLRRRWPVACRPHARAVLTWACRAACARPAPREWGSLSTGTARARGLAWPLLGSGGAPGACPVAAWEQVRLVQGWEAQRLLPSA